MRPGHAIVYRYLERFTVLSLDLKPAKLHVGDFSLDQMFNAIEASPPYQVCRHGSYP